MGRGIVADPDAGVVNPYALDRVRAVQRVDRDQRQSAVIEPAVAVDRARHTVQAGRDQQLAGQDSP